MPDSFVFDISADDQKLLAQVVGYALSHENSPDLQAVIMDADTELFEVTDSESDRTLRPFADALWNAACTKDTKQRLAEAYAELVESRREYARDRQLAERYHVNI